MKPRQNHSSTHNNMQTDRDLKDHSKRREITIAIPRNGLFKKLTTSWVSFTSFFAAINKAPFCCWLSQQQLSFLSPLLHHCPSVSWRTAHYLKFEQQTGVFTCSSPARSHVRSQCRSPRSAHHGPVLCCCRIAHHRRLETQKIQIRQANQYVKNRKSTEEYFLFHLLRV